jgi:ElaA protein
MSFPPPTITAFADLSPEMVYKILKLRSAIFVVEQNCVYQDMDDLDLTAQHLFFTCRQDNENDEIIAYCRLLKPGVKYAEWSIGRVVTAQKWRGQNWGHHLMQSALRTIKAQGGQACRISAQSHLKAFYESHGFIATDKAYLEDGIPHLEMFWQITA